MYCFCYFLGSQLNVDSDDEDTPFEDDDDDDSQSDIDVADLHLPSNNSADVRFIRQPSPNLKLRIWCQKRVKISW